MVRVGATIACIVLAGVAARADADDRRARQNYLLHCAGCHGEAGAGLEGHVPAMRDVFARLSATAEGRSYVLRVPGVAQASLSPELVAEILNWSLREFSTAAAASAVAPFTAAEVEAGKTQPLLEVAATRERLLRTIGLR
jgi:hypothetical protein